MPAMFDGSTTPAHDASVALFVDYEGESAEIMFYENEDDLVGKLVGVVGALENLDTMRWLAKSAAERHGIDFHEERRDG